MHARAPAMRTLTTGHGAQTVGARSLTSSRGAGGPVGLPQAQILGTTHPDCVMAKTYILMPMRSAAVVAPGPNH